MSLLGKILKKVGDIGSDIARIVTEPVKSTYESITGKTIDTGNYNTKVGKLLGGSVKLGEDVAHSAAQSFANTVTAGYASKLHEKIVPGIVNKQAMLQGTSTKIFGGGVLSDIEKGLKKAAPVAGSLVASVVGSKTEKTAPQVVNVGDVSATIKNTGIAGASNMGLLSSITQGINKAGDALVKFTNSGVGQITTGVLANYVANLATPTQSKQPFNANTQAQAQEASLISGISNTPDLTQLQNATINGKGITVSLGQGSSSQWWVNNKVWALPTAIAVGVVVVVILFISIFKRKRRR